MGQDADALQFQDAPGVTWSTGIAMTKDGTRYRWFSAVGRQERRYELRNGEAKDESVMSLRAQLHASIAVAS